MTPNESSPAVFLDRDGTLMRDVELLLRSETGGDFRRRAEALRTTERARLQDDRDYKPKRNRSRLFHRDRISRGRSGSCAAARPRFDRRDLFLPRSSRTDRRDCRKPAPGMVFEAQRDITSISRVRFSSATKRSTPSADATPACGRFWSDRFRRMTDGSCADLGRGRFRSGSRRSFCMQAHDKAVGIIPARWGSTRFPGQAAASHRRQAAAPACLGTLPPREDAWTSVIIATDDMRIAEAAFDWGAEVAMTSSKHPAGPTASPKSREHAKTFRTSSNSGRRTADRSEVDRSAR